MPELLIAPPIAPSASPAPSPKPTAPDSKAAASSASSETSKTGNTAPTSDAGTDGAPKTFASMLKQQMNQAKEATAKDAKLAPDPQILAAEALPELPAGDAASLLPFIEQLLPQLAKKFQATEEKTDTATDTAVAAVDTTAALIAGPVTAAVEGAEKTATSATVDAAAPQETAALPLEAETATQGNKPAQPSAGENLAAASAISAEGTLSEAKAGNRTETDFSALMTRATEQLASNGQAHAPAHAANASSGPAETSLRMDTPVGHADWSKELGNKLSWMATAQRQQADLVLNPPQLGRVEISLTVSGDQASAVFASPSAAVRELLEDSLPRLREILSGAGINLGEAQVGAESQNRFGAQDQKGDNARGGRTEPVRTVELNGVSPTRAGERMIASGRGMVDLFA